MRRSGGDGEAWRRRFSAEVWAGAAYGGGSRRRCGRAATEEAAGGAARVRARRALIWARRDASRARRAVEVASTGGAPPRLHRRWCQTWARWA
jgi:hypothetical protein